MPIMFDIEPRVWEARPPIVSTLSIQDLNY